MTLPMQSRNDQIWCIVESINLLKMSEYMKLFGWSVAVCKVFLDSFAIYSRFIEIIVLLVKVPKSNLCLLEAIWITEV